MPHYKDTDEKLHYLDTTDFEYLLPAGCVKVTEEEVSAILLSKVISPSLDELRKAAYSKIDAAAYQTRLKFITPNKDSTYLAKSLQVDAYIAAGYPLDLTNFGYIKAEVARLGGDVAVQSDLITAADGLVAIRNAWITIDSMIEEIALVAKMSVGKKIKDTTIQAVVDQAIIDLGAV